MQLRYDLRSWQESALDAWRAEGRRGIVEVVTGGGKTVFAEACILSALDAHPSLRVVIVVPTIALVDQWYVSLQEELSVEPHDIAVFAGGRRPKFARLNLMVINTARDAAPALSKSGLSMLVVDECHRAGSAENVRALQGSYVATLGLSATPERPYDDALDEAIVPALGRIIYRYDLVRARADGVVTPFHLTNVEVALLPDEQEKYDRLTRRIGQKLGGRADHSGPMPEGISELLRQRGRVAALATMRIPTTVHLADIHRGNRLMIFHEDIAALTRICAALKSRGHSVTEYHTGISPVLRRSNLRLYRQGVFDIMASCRALDEGINIPETQVAVIASASATARQRIQRLGRVLRPSRGKDQALVFTIFATNAERDRLTSEALELTGTATVSWLKVGGRSDAVVG